jgi:hypothetical protein
MIPRFASGVGLSDRESSLYAHLDAARSGAYPGGDPAQLATVIVDGHGLVSEVRLVATISRHAPARIVEAVRLAYDDAERGRMNALRKVAEQSARLRESG